MSIMNTNIFFLSRSKMELKSFYMGLLTGKSKALRLPWVYRIINDNGRNDIVQEYLAPLGGLLFLLSCYYDMKFLYFTITIKTQLCKASVFYIIVY